MKEFDYMFLDRLKSDCNYYLGNGGRYAKNLYYGDEKEHINKMKELYNKFPDNEKPEWLTHEDILAYEKSMLNK